MSNCSFNLAEWILNEARLKLKHTNGKKTWKNKFVLACNFLLLLAQIYVIDILKFYKK